MKPVKFESFHKSHQRIFGSKPTFREMALGDGINRHQRRVINTENVSEAVITRTKPTKSKKKTLCPHCATTNLIKVDAYSNECTNCGWNELS